MVFLALAAVPFINGKQRFPLLPLRFTGGNLGVKPLRDATVDDAVKGLGDEFAFFPEHLLEPFDLCQKFDDMAAHLLDKPHRLEPTLGHSLSCGFHLI